MKKEDEKNFRGRIMSALLTFLCVGFFSFTAFGSVDLSVDYGYRNTAKTGQLLPVTVTVENSSGDTIDGFISVDIPGEDGSISYTTSVCLPEGSTVLKYTVTIPDGLTESGGDRLLARLFDDSGCEIASAATTVTYLGTGREVLCGILSDDQQNLMYLGNVSLGENLSTRVVTLNPADLPDSEDGLNQLDIIVISSISLTRLSDSSVSAVMAWVKTGGTLIIGTGEKLSSLGAFRTLIGNPELGLTGSQNVDMGMQYSTTGPDGAVLSMKLRKISWPDAEIIRESGDWDLVLRRTFGRGSVCLAAFDLCTLKTFCTEHPDYTQDLLSDAVGQTGLSRISGSLLSSEERQTASREITNTYDEAEIPEIAWYAVGAALFICFTGVILYRVLRFRGLGIYYMFGVLILSLFFSLLFWLASSATRITKPFIRYGTVTEFSQGDEENTKVSMKGYIDLQSNSESAVTLELPVDVMVRPVIINGSVSITSGKKKMLAVAGQKQFEANIFRVEQKTETADVTLPLSAGLQMGADGLNGTVKNSGETEMSGVTLLCRGKLWYFGTLKPGESVSFDSRGAVHGPMLSSGTVSSYLGELDGEASLSLQRDSLRSNFLRGSVSLSEGKILLIGFAENQRPSFLEHTSYDTRGSSLTVLELEEPEEDTDGISLKIPETEPKVVSGSFDLSTGCLKGSGAAVLEYTLGGSEKLDGIEFRPLSTELEGKDVTAFRGQMAMYNYSTGSFDLTDAGKLSWQAEELKSYLSPSGNLTVRFLPDEERLNTLPVYLPQLYVRGTEKDRTSSGTVPGSGMSGEAVSGGPTDAGT